MGLRAPPVKADRRHANLVALKNAAYAWRQMVFYLALMDRPAAEAFLPWARDHLGRQREPFPTRFRPALAGLELAARGAPEGDAAEQHGARRFLGWTTGPHWLLQ